MWAEGGRSREWPGGVTERQNAIWALTRIEFTPAREAVRLALLDADTQVRLTALRSATLHRDEDAAKFGKPVSDLCTILLSDFGQPSSSLFPLFPKDPPYRYLIGQ